MTDETETPPLHETLREELQRLEARGSKNWLLLIVMQLLLMVILGMQFYSIVRMERHVERALNEQDNIQGRQTNMLKAQASHGSILKELLADKQIQMAHQDTLRKELINGQTDYLHQLQSRFEENQVSLLNASLQQCVDENEAARIDLNQAIQQAIRAVFGPVSNRGSE